MSGRAARVLIVKIARYAHYNGPSLSIGPSDNSLARMNVRNGSHALHLDLQKFEIWRFSGFQPDNVTLSKSENYAGLDGVRATHSGRSYALGSCSNDQWGD